MTKKFCNIKLINNQVTVNIRDVFVIFAKRKSETRESTNHINFGIDLKFHVFITH